MRTSLRKLRGYAKRHGEQKDRTDFRPSPLFDELNQASRDMEDMKDCYDSLLSAAAATANSAYEFSESLREMGACLLEKTALNDDEESGKVLLMLGKVQFELQKLVDSYRSHIFQTITIPSESLLNELQNVEEMKRQCDDKRSIYDRIMKQREKGRGRSGKADGFAIQQLQAAHDEYDEEATLFIFRLKSLKRGQSRSLLTQASRHHAAQLCFFKKALKSLEALEPHVKLVTEQHHIDYHFNGLEDDGDDGDEDDEEEGDEDHEDDGDETYDTPDDGELSFEYGQIDQEQAVSTSRTSMELDMVDVTFPKFAKVEAAKENLERNRRRSFSFKREFQTSSQSAPLFAENKSEPIGRTKQMRSSYTRKFNSYVLPTPVDIKSQTSTVSGSPVPQTLKTSLSRRNLWHSSPLEPEKYEKLLAVEKFPASVVNNTHSVLRESNKNTSSTALPPPLADLSITRSDSKKIKRYAFSGPITSKAWPTKSVSVETPGLFSGPHLHYQTVKLQSSSPKISPKVSPKASPTFVSSPKISELHELPRPPSNSASKSSRPLSLVGHSAPLGPKGDMHRTGTSLVSNASSPLPVPYQAVTRSYSIPSSSPGAIALDMSKPLETTKNLKIAEEMNSPPLTPISLSSIHSSLIASQNVNQTIQIRGAD